MSTFAEFSRENGLIIDHLAIGKINRVKTVDHPTKRNGAYFFDGVRGWVMDWANGDQIKWWSNGESKPWTDQEKLEWTARRKRADEEKKLLRAKAAKTAHELISLASYGRHQYLDEKGHGDVLALVSHDEKLLIPMRDVDTNELLGVQCIFLDENRWNKKMTYGMRAKGAVFKLGKTQQEAYLVEGYATALSVDAALKMLRLKADVIVCFSAVNLRYVAGLLSGRVFIFADNDHSKTGEVSAQSTGLPYCMSDQVGEDANDLFNRAGVMAVAKKIMEVRQK